MGNDLRAYLDAMEGRIIAKINDGQERIVNRLSALERDFTYTKGFLVEDSIRSSRRWLDMDDRMTKIERGEKPYSFAGRNAGLSETSTWCGGA